MNRYIPESSNTAIHACTRTYQFLIELHPAFDITVNSMASIQRVSTLCNQLLSHLLADILQTLYSCYGQIEDVHVIFRKYSDIFAKSRDGNFFSIHVFLIDCTHSV
jgi:hypothetical protein